MNSGNTTTDGILDSVAQAESCLVGQLETWPLSDLLLWISKTGRSAMVRVGVGLEAGVMFFHSGHCFRCEWGSLRGEEAFHALLDLRQGLFSLIQRDVPAPRPNISTPTEHLLLQHAVAQDERGARAIA